MKNDDKLWQYFLRTGYEHDIDITLLWIAIGKAGRHKTFAQMHCYVSAHISRMNKSRRKANAAWFYKIIPGQLKRTYRLTLKHVDE